MRTEYPASEAHLAIEDIGTEVLDGLYAAIEQVGADMVQHIQDRSALPYPPASVDGTYPHRRTGEFVDGLNAVFDYADQTLTLYSATHDRHGWYLQNKMRDGTTRPYVDLMLGDRDWGARIGELAREAMQE